jgi:C_GCAxxG_C_C family probable redox protein
VKIPQKAKAEILNDAEVMGYEFEKKHHGCAQCVLGALMELFDMKDPNAFKAATGLGGGVGLTIEGSCGGLTGGVMAISMWYGRELDEIADPEGVRFLSYRLANELHERFVREYGSSICKEIHKQVLGKPYRLNRPEEFEAFLAAGGHEEKCPGVVGKAARWAAEIILDQQEK